MQSALAYIIHSVKVITILNTKFFLTNLPNDSHYPQTVFNLVKIVELTHKETKSITIISRVKDVE